MNFWDIYQLPVLRWLHIVAMVYWLGGEWGIFQTSYNVINRELPMDERRRHMETTYRIDILARSGIILLLPLGLHMGNLWGIQPLGGPFLVIIWAVFALWLGLCWTAFIYRETDTGIRLTKIDERVRFVVIPALVFIALWSLWGQGPLSAGEGQKWFSVKMLLYSVTLMIGLKMRFIMREWTVMFRKLATQVENPEVEAILERSIRFARKLAYVYWLLILSAAFFGAVKPL